MANRRFRRLTLYGDYEYVEQDETTLTLWRLWDEPLQRVWELNWSMDLLLKELKYEEVLPLPLYLQVDDEF